jgi:hypothetical protein
MSNTDAPTTEERYSRAARSSHLEMHDERPGDVDTLIAAGLVSESLGTHIWRLMVEFDGVRGSLRRGAINQTERFLIMGQLKSLRSAREQLGAFAIIRATKGRHMINDHAVMAVTGRVLDVFLDPLCHHCEGRGYNGGSHRGERQVVCRPCRGSGHRRGWIGRSPVEQEFAAHLLVEMERSLGTIAAEVRRYRHVVDEAKRRIAADVSLI